MIMLTRVHPQTSEEFLLVEKAFLSIPDFTLRLFSNESERQQENEREDNLTLNLNKKEKSRTISDSDDDSKC